MRLWFASRARMVAKRRRSYGSRWMLPVEVRAHVLSLKPRHLRANPAPASIGRVMSANTGAA